MRILLSLSILLLCVSGADAARYLSVWEKSQVKAAKKTLGEVHKKPLHATIYEIEEASFTSGQLEAFKATAKTYKSILKEYPDLSDKKKQWVYDQILMRVAYIQFGGKLTRGHDSTLGRYIHKTLLKHLPEKLVNDPRFNQTLK